MTLLNTPMPAERALKIIRSIFESNNTVGLDAHCQFPKSYTNDPFKSYLFSIEDCELFEEGYSDILEELSIIITKVFQTIPTYSVWDKVLILSTGEIGNVTKIRWDHRDKPIELNNDTDMFYHRSEICKLPNDL